MPAKLRTPKKPRPDFPLTPRPDGRWCKRVRRKLHIFPGPSAKEALDQWLEVKDDLLAGRTPRTKLDCLTVLELCDKFLAAKAIQRDAGELRQLTWADYKRTAKRIVAVFGKERAVHDLKPEDFELLKGSMTKTMGVVAIGNEVNRVRVIFRYGFEAGHMLAPVKFGPHFKRPEKDVLRKEKKRRPTKKFTASELRQLMALATPQLRAMIQLGVNCALGNTDCALLEFRHLDLDGGWLDYPRPKTGIDRRCKLWPETVAAIRDAIAIRRVPKNPKHAGLVFITAARGSFYKETTDNPVSKEFSKILKAAGLQQSRRNFYALRHTFRTIAGGAKDVSAARMAMGHTNQHVEDGYDHFDNADERLTAVSAHVRRWLFPQEEKPGAAKRQPKPIAADRPLLRIVG